MVFNRFWRADPARARTSGGTGLGLSIALEDTHLHGGWLQAWGRPGEGAQFRLTLPRRAGFALRRSPLPLQPDDAGDARRRDGAPVRTTRRRRLRAAVPALAAGCSCCAGCTALPESGPGGRGRRRARRSTRSRASDINAVPPTPGMTPQRRDRQRASSTR